MYRVTQKHGENLLLTLFCRFWQLVGCYCRQAGRMVKHHKFKSTGGFCRSSVSPALYKIYWKSLPGSLSHPPREEPRDGRADGGERLHGGPDGGRDPRYRRVGATVLRDDVTVKILNGARFNTILMSLILFWLWISD